MNRILVTARNKHFPALSDGASKKAHPAAVNARCAPAARPSLQVAGRAAPLFDATEGRWIVPPSGVKPDAGAAADLRHTQAAQTRPTGSLAPLRPVGRPLLEAVSEALKMAAGLTVFGLIAGVFLVLA